METYSEMQPEGGPQSLGQQIFSLQTHCWGNAEWYPAQKWVSGGICEIYELYNEVTIELPFIELSHSMSTWNSSK